MGGFELFFCSGGGEFAYQKIAGVVCSGGGG